MKVAPIALFVFNRLDHTKLTIESLKNNYLAKDSELYIFSDQGRNNEEKKTVKEIREYIKRIEGFKKVTVIERNTNFGLAKSIISGVTEIINIYKKIIVLEDDLVTSKNYLNYMNHALEFYKSNNEIFSISGFNFNENYFKVPSHYNDNVYLHYRPMSWGWASWIDRWDKCDWDVNDYETFIKNKREIKKFNQGGEDLTNMLKLQMNGKINSWYIRFCYSAYKNNALTVYPIKSFISNIGFDGTGSHCIGNSNKYHNELVIKDEINNDFFSNNIKIDETLIFKFNKNFQPPNLITKILNRLKKV